MSGDRSVVDRAENFNHLGRQLLKLVSPRNLSGVFSRMSVTEQIIATDRPQDPNGRPWGHMDRVAASLLLCDFPTQLDLGTEALLDIVSAAYEGGVQRVPRADDPHYILKALRNPKILHTPFPLKKHPGASNKVNLRLIELLQGLHDMGEAQRYNNLLWALRGQVTSDQATMALLYARCLEPHLPKQSHAIALAAVTQPYNAKGLSVALKALGLNGLHAGAMLCEADVLQGRDVGTCDLHKEATYRCDPKAVEASVVHFDDAELRAAVRDILAEELDGRQPHYQNLDDFWNSRWAWCVNGSHSRVLERAERSGPQSKAAYPGMNNDQCFTRWFIFDNHSR
jgi:hypothetical protein